MGGSTEEDPREDRQLVNDVLARRAGAFERLVARHQRLAWHVVYRMVPNSDDTRELCQEVFLRVHRRLSTFRFESALSTWIGRIAFSIAARHLERKRLPLAEPFDDEAVAPAERVADDFDLEAALADAELVEKLHEAIAALPPLQRTLLTLYHLDECSVAQVAAIVEMPEGTVKNYLFRARAKLRHTLCALLGERP